MYFPLSETTFVNMEHVSKAVLMSDAVGMVLDGKSITASGDFAKPIMEYLKRSKSFMAVGEGLVFVNLKKVTAVKFYARPSIFLEGTSDVLATTEQANKIAGRE